MSARYFFHLYNRKEVIPDEVGVEVGGADHVGDAFVQIMRGMQRLNVSELVGWEMRVVNAAGIVVMTFRLGDLKELSPAIE
jgi:hypothetical protein